MNKRIKPTIGIGLAVLLLVAVFATAAFAQGPGGAFGGGMMGGQGFGGMMGGRGQSSFGGMMGNSQGMMGGMMGVMMGGRWNQPTGAMTVTVAQARTTAQQWLDVNQPGAKLADDEMQFPGYYTMDFLKDGETAGMLSVNGYTGQVWYHTWHGNFIGEKMF